MRWALITIIFLSTTLVGTTGAEARFGDRLRARFSQNAPAPQQTHRVAETPQFSPGQACPKCGKVHSSNNVSPDFATPVRSGISNVAASGAQAMAQRRANWMASRGYKNHPPSSAGSFVSVGGAFEGVGWSSSGSMPPTCVPGRRGSVADTSGPQWVCIGDATARGRDGNYRCRIWARR